MFNWLEQTNELLKENGIIMPDDLTFVSGKYKLIFSINEEEKMYYAYNEKYGDDASYRNKEPLLPREVFEIIQEFLDGK